MRVLIAAGGTGGHLYPAIVLGNELLKTLFPGRSWRIISRTRLGMSCRPVWLLPTHKILMSAIWVSSLDCEGFAGGVQPESRTRIATKYVTRRRIIGFYDSNTDGTRVISLVSES